MKIVITILCVTIMFCACNKNYKNINEAQTRVILQNREEFKLVNSLPGKWLLTLMTGSCGGKYRRLIGQNYMNAEEVWIDNRKLLKFDNNPWELYFTHEYKLTKIISLHSGGFVVDFDDYTLENEMYVLSLSDDPYSFMNSMYFKLEGRKLIQYHCEDDLYKK